MATFVRSDLRRSSGTGRTAGVILLERPIWDINSIQGIVIIIRMKPQYLPSCIIHRVCIFFLRFCFSLSDQIINSQITPGATFIQSRSQISKTRSQLSQVDPSRLKVDPAYRNIFKVDPSTLGMFWMD